MVKYGFEFDFMAGRRNDLLIRFTLLFALIISAAVGFPDQGKWTYSVDDVRVTNTWTTESYLTGLILSLFRKHVISSKSTKRFIPILISLLKVSVLD